jgi:DNA-binding NtrC family response regulator
MAEGRTPSSPARSLRILLVEDNDALRAGLSISLGERFGEVAEERSGEAAVARLSDPGVPAPQVVVADLRLPGADGIAVLRAAKRRDPGIGVVVMSAYGSVEGAVEAMRIGAADFVQKPFELEHLEQCVIEAARRDDDNRGTRSPERSARRELGAGIVAESPAMREAVSLARRVADTRSTVLITGETGTGKEIIAGLVHSLSRRAAQPFVEVNCAALPETLLESELFGHERGAFTGADRTRIGRFEQASGGTLFLDEIGDITPATQAKLLRVLQDQEFHRLGGTRALRTDARIVAATNQDLKEARRLGRFREDLYFRLDVIGIQLLPLRERREDLVAITEALLVEFAAEFERPHKPLSRAARERVLAYGWPGNVRELRNVIERAVLTSSTECIEPADLALVEWAGQAGAWRPELPPEGVSLSRVERELVIAALERTGYVQKDAAALLHVSRRKLNYMIRRMGLTHPTWRRNRQPDAADAASD